MRYNTSKIIHTSNGLYGFKPGSHLFEISISINISISRRSVNRGRISISIRKRKHFLFLMLMSRYRKCEPDDISISIMKQQYLISAEIQVKIDSSLFEININCAF